MTEACTHVTSTISTASWMKPSEFSSMWPNQVCIFPKLSECESRGTAVLPHMSSLINPLFSYEERKLQSFWDGTKSVYVVLQGTTVVLPCINRRSIWTDWSNEEEDQQARRWARFIDRLSFLCHFVITIASCVTFPGCPLGPASARSPAWPCRSAGGPLRLRWAAQLRTSVLAEEDEHQQSGLFAGWLLSHDKKSPGMHACVKMRNIYTMV